MHKIHHFLKSLSNSCKNINTPSAILLGAVIVGLSIVSYGFIMRPSTAQAAMAIFQGKDVDQNDYVEGNTKSNVVIVEYSDPECPFCVQLHPTMKQIRNEYASKIAFVYRHFPLTSIHPHSFDEARAIACAGSVGGEKKYYEYIDALFGYKADHQTTQLPATGKEDFAKSIGLDIAAFTSCMNNPASSDTVNAEIQDGVNAGVQGTPSSFILLKTRKGYQVISMIDGARPYAYIKAAIDEALAKD